MRRLSCSKNGATGTTTTLLQTYLEAHENKRLSNNRDNLTIGLAEQGWIDLASPRMSISWLCSHVIFNFNPAGPGALGSPPRQAERL